MIEWSEIGIKHQSGQHKYKCPACSHERKNKSDRSLSVNLNDGVAKCHHCGEVAIRDFKYSLPPQKWEEKHSPKFLEYCKSRGISENTLLENYVGEEQHYIAGANRNCIVFNYYEGTILYNKKYRDGKKRFAQFKDAKKIFYGLNHIEKETIIVEGEFDKLALWEVGIKNVISVPNGAKDFNDVYDNCKKYFKDVYSIVIAVDNDQAGRELENDILQKLGKSKCWRVDFGKYKDANDVLVEEGKEELLRIMTNKIGYPVDGLYSIKDLEYDIYSFYDHGIEDTLYKMENNPYFSHLDKIFTHSKGTFDVTTGIAGHGKSNWTEWYLMNLINEHDLKLAVFSPEHMPIGLYQSKWAGRAIGKTYLDKNFRFTREELKQYLEWAEGRLYMVMPKQGVDWDWMFNKMEEIRKRKGIDIFLIDAFNKVKIGGSNKVERIEEVMREMADFCTSTESSIKLIAHPTKTRKDDKQREIMPTLGDIKGSNDFEAQIHNGFGVYRDYDAKTTEFHTLKIKHEHLGQPKKSFTYYFDYGRFYVKGLQPNSIPIWEKQQTIDYYGSQEGFVDNGQPYGAVKKRNWGDADDIPF
jgi:twinkle protein